MSKRFQQHRRQDFQRTCKLEHNRQARYFVAALYLADVGRCEAGPVGEIFLRPLVVLTDATDDRSEDCSLSRFRHMWK